MLSKPTALKAKSKDDRRNRRILGCETTRYETMLTAEIDGGVGLVVFLLFSLSLRSSDRSLLVLFTLSQTER